jgi:Glycosyltransferase Family 4
LKILHLSHESLPDWRIEKSAISALNNGDDVAFAGDCPKNYAGTTFSEVHSIAWTAKARFGVPFYWDSVKKQLGRIIKKSRPDIVHAHNLFSAKMISEFEIPFVYDDHEYWSLHVRLLEEMAELDKSKGVENFLDLPRRIRRRFINKYAVHLWTKWENEMISSRPTITVSSKIAEEMKIKAPSSEKILVVPNYPLRTETRSSTLHPVPHANLSCIYAGSDGRNKEKYPHRNIDGFIDLFRNRDLGDLTIVGWDGSSSKNTKYLGYLTRDSMYSEMSKHSIGFIPFKKHWSHAYLDPNKAYEYAHAGLFVMCTDSLTTIEDTLRENCSTFESYEMLASQLEYFKANPEILYNKRLKIFEFAKRTLIWENNEKEIFRAYQLA